jgi:DNA-directed RNA polymerase specialized sigma24 family protein
VCIEGRKKFLAPRERLASLRNEASSTFAEPVRSHGAGARRLQGLPMPTPVRGDIMTVSKIASPHKAGSSRSRERAAEAEVAKLPSDEAAFLRMRFGVGQPHERIAEIAAASGWSFAEVQQIQARALKRLRWRSLRANAHTEWDEV